MIGKTYEKILDLETDIRYLNSLKKPTKQQATKLGAYFDKRIALRREILMELQDILESAKSSKESVNRIFTSIIGE
jgi:hypothetical protein